MGFNRDTFVPNPALCSQGSIKEQQSYRQHFAFIGKIMGAGMRTSNPLGLDLPPLIWKRFLSEPVTVQDLAGIDERFVRALQVIGQHSAVSSWAALGLTGAASVVGCAGPNTNVPGSPSASAVSASSLAAVGGWGAGGGGGGGEGEAWGGGGASSCASGMLLVWTVRSVSGRLVELVPGGGDALDAQAAVAAHGHRVVFAPLPKQNRLITGWCLQRPHPRAGPGHRRGTCRGCNAARVCVCLTRARAVAGPCARSPGRRTRCRRRGSWSSGRCPRAPPPATAKQSTSSFHACQKTPARVRVVVLMA